MKHYAVNLCVLSLCILAACGNSNSLKNHIDQPYEEVESAVEVIESKSSETEPLDTASFRKSSLNFAEYMGLRSPRFAKDNYLEYSEDPSNISADPNYVAQQMYTLFCDDPTLEGVRIMNTNGKDIIAEYP